MVNFYVDGQLVKTESMAHSYVVDIDNQLYLGRYNSNKSFNWDGMLDDVRIYNYLLDSPEIDDLYQKKELVAHWKLDEGRGTLAFDSSGNGNSGVVTGGAWSDGTIDGALDFDGKDDYIACGSRKSLSVDEKITISAWLYSRRASRYSIPVARGEFDNDGWYWRLESDGWHVSINRPGQSVSLNSNYVLPVEEWHHLVSVIDNANLLINFYVDGELISTAPMSFAFSTDVNRQLYLGGYGANNNYNWDGLLDDVRIYNYDLELAEIEGLCALGQKGYEEPGIVGHWDFDEGEGLSVYDSSGFNNDGRVDGAGWFEGIAGNALDFDGVDDYVSCENNGSLNTNYQISISAWVNYGQLSGRGIPISRGEFNKHGWFWWLDDEGWRITINRQDESSTINSNYKPAAGEWHHLTVIIDNLRYKVKFYVDGELIATEPAGYKFALDKSSRLYIGTYNDSNNYNWKGLVDDVRIYNYALAASEVKELYDSVIGQIVKPGLAGYWKFDKMNGRYVYDSAGHSNDGSIIGADWAKGTIDGALAFDGVNDYVICNKNRGLNIENNVTVAAWVYNRHVSGSGVPVSDGVYNKYGWYWWLGDNGWRVTVNRPGESFTIDSNYTPASDEWHHLASVIDNDNLEIRFYADGALIDTAVLSYPFEGSGSELYFGRYSENSNYNWNGLLDDVRIYNVALEGSEIEDVFKLGMFVPSEPRAVGLWRLDEDDGEIAFDRSGFLNNGFVNGAERVSGVSGNALSFDGADDYVSCINNGSLNVSNKISIAAWVNNRHSSGYGIPISRGEFNNYGWYWWLDSRGWRVSVNRLNESISVDSNYSLPLDEWHHLVSIIDNENLEVRFYVDGALVSSVPLSFPFDENSSSKLYLGMSSLNNNNNYYWNGMLDEVHIYNYDLSSTEIQGLFELSQNSPGGKFRKQIMPAFYKPVVSGPITIADFLGFNRFFIRPRLLAFYNGFFLW